jgi:hypothetical protein
MTLTYTFKDTTELETPDICGVNPGTDITFDECAELALKFYLQQFTKILTINKELNKLSEQNSEQTDQSSKD